MTTANGSYSAHRRSRRSRGKASPQNAAVNSRAFWGEAEKLPPPEEVAITPDPSAVVRSLGRPPFTGHEAVSEYYLRAVYDNTVKLAEVLATAGDLLEGSADDER